MYIWNYLLSIAFFIINRFLAFLFAQTPSLYKIFQKSTIPSVLIIILVEGHIQYITFTFFRQVLNPHIRVFMDKINMIVSVLFMFVVVIYTLCSYVVYSSFLSRKNLNILFPLQVKSKPLTMLLIIFNGPGRSLLLGLFQAFYENFPLQMILLIVMNVFTLLVLRLLRCTKIPGYLIFFKKWFILIITLYLVITLFDHYNLILFQGYYEMGQLLCVCFLWTICILDFIYGLTNFILELTDWIFKKCKNRNRVGHDHSIKKDIRKLKQSNL